MSANEQTPRERLAAKHASELAQLEREERMRAAIPQGIDAPRTVHASGEHRLSIKYEPATLGAAYTVFRQYADAGLLIPSIYYVGTFHHWEPDALIDARKNRKEYEAASRELETVAELRSHGAWADGHFSYYTVALSFWVSLPDVGPVEVACDIGGYRPPGGLQMRPVRNGNARNSGVARWEEPPALSSYWHQKTRVGGDPSRQSIDARFYWCFDAWESEFVGAIDAMCRDIGEPGIKREGE